MQSQQFNTQPQSQHVLMFHATLHTICATPQSKGKYVQTWQCAGKKRGNDKIW